VPGINRMLGERWSSHASATCIAVAPSRPATSESLDDCRAATAMSPIQYQRRLRLLEARRLMTDEGETAEASAFSAGYRSAPQFSREYSCMFGHPPLRDSLKLGETGHPILQMVRGAAGTPPARTCHSSG
jgi:hypothetical protein